MDGSNCSCGLASSQYDRGPTDTNPSMTPREKEQARAIESACGGRATSSQSGMADDMSKQSRGPGMV